MIENRKKTFKKIYDIILKLYIYGTTALFLIVGLALIGEFISIELFNLKQLTGIVILLFVVTMWLPFWEKVNNENKPLQT